MEPLVVAGALAGGVGLAGLAVFAAWRYTRPSRASQPEADAVEMEILRDDERPVTFVPPAPRPPARPASASPSAPGAAPRQARPPPPPSSPRAHPERAPAMILTAGVTMSDDAFSRYAPPRGPGPVPLPMSAAARPPAPRPAHAPAPAPAAPHRPPPRMPPMKSWAQEVRDTLQPEVPTEWARRQVGPVEPGRVAGACGGCGARLSVSDARPLRIACPVCGRTKLVA